MWSEMRARQEKKKARKSKPKFEKSWRRLFFPFLFIIVFAGIFVSCFQQGDNNGYAVAIGENQYRFDLLDARSLPNTLEIQPNATVSFNINATCYLQKINSKEANFDLHLVLQRANIVIRDERTGKEEQVTDFSSRIFNSRFVINEEMTITIKNVGIRSAIFEASIIPQG